MIDITTDTTSEGAVHVVALRAGENRCDLELVTALSDALADLAVAGGPVVLTGEGRYFSTGLDLEWLAGASPEDAGAMFERLFRVMAQLLAFPGVVVAAVNGHAFGAGAVLAAAADHRFMRAERGYLCFPEVDLGLVLSPEMAAVVELRLPPQALHHALLSGHRYTGEQARDVGLVDGVAAGDDLRAAAIAVAREHGAKDPASVGAIKRAQSAAALAVLPDVAPAGARG